MYKWINYILANGSFVGLLYLALRGSNAASIIVVIWIWLMLLIALLGLAIMNSSITKEEIDLSKLNPVINKPFICIFLDVIFNISIVVILFYNFWWVTALAYLWYMIFIWMLVNKLKQYTYKIINKEIIT